MTLVFFVSFMFQSLAQLGKTEKTAMFNNLMLGAITLGIILIIIDLFF
jgi:triphosphoribosyl-dephospho-CoA synthetase